MTTEPNSYHVVPNAGKGGWDFKKDGATRSSGHFETKQEALLFRLPKLQTRALLVGNRGALKRGYMGITATYDGNIHGTI